MIVERTTDAARINAVLNHPSIYPWICGDLGGAFDIAAVLAKPGTHALFGEHGGVIFGQMQPGLYEVHTQVLPEGRGAWAVNMARECARWIFTHTDAVECVTRVPRGNHAARALTQLIGGKFEFRQKNAWTLLGRRVAVDWYALRIQDWMRDAGGLIERGAWFHNKLEDEYRRLGVPPDLHEQDDVHDRYVGAAVEMMMGGQPHKALVFYNRWAAMAGYEPIQIRTLNPLVIDIRDALLLVRANDFWVMQCQQVASERVPLPQAH